MYLPKCSLELMTTPVQIPDAAPAARTLCRAAWSRPALRPERFPSASGFAASRDQLAAYLQIKAARPWEQAGLPAQLLDLAALQAPVPSNFDRPSGRQRFLRRQQWARAPLLEPGCLACSAG